MTAPRHQQPTARTLADLRREAGLSQSEVAHRMGVKQARVSQIEATYPNVAHTSVLAYIQAIGGRIHLTGVGDIVLDTQIHADDERELTRASMARSSRKGADTLRRNASRPSEELPLKQRSPHPSGDDTRRNIDEPHPESHQGDRKDRQQP